MRRTLMGRAVVLVFAFLVAGCSHFPINDPLLDHQPDHGYRFRAQGDDNNEVFVALSLSGGGTRAAALSYGVLEALRATNDERQRRLLDEVDLVTAVSGGSLTAAYWSIHGEKIFEEFPPRFLYHDVQGDLLRSMFSPRSWFRFLGEFERIDLVAEYLDNRLYQGATFADLVENRPFVLINATDISMGSRFAFHQETFDRLCSDLDSYPVARAVAASAAVPVVTSPITLRNYGWSACGFESPKWAKPIHRESLSSRLQREARNIHSLREPEDRAYVHLFDGGLADNLGIFGLFDRYLSADRACAFMEPLQASKMRHLAVIVVDAATELDRSADLRKKGPNLTQTIWAMANIPIDRHSQQVRDDLEVRLERWREQFEACSNRPDAHQIKIYPIIVDFNSVQDIELRSELLATPTSLSLPRWQVDQLRKIGFEGLLNTKEFQDLAKELGMPLPSSFEP